MGSNLKHSLSLKPADGKVDGVQKLSILACEAATSNPPAAD